MNSELLEWLTSSMDSLRTGLTQDTRPVRVRIGADGASGFAELAAALADTLVTPLFVHKFHIQERACSDDPLRMRLLCICIRPDLSPRSLLGQPIQLQLVTDRGTVRTINAVIVLAQPCQFDAGLQTWRIEAVDALTYMNKGRRRRYFPDMSVLQITEVILREWQDKSATLGGCFDFSLANLDASRYPVRRMTMQWNESDSAFLIRLWRKSAIGWGILPAEIDADPDTRPSMVHSLVLFDDASSLPANAAGSLRYHLDTKPLERNAITMWSPAAQLVPGNVERHSQDFKTQQTQQHSAPTLLDLGEVGNDVAGALLDFQLDSPHHADDGEEYARLGDRRMAYHEMVGAIVQGASGARDVAPLTWVTVEDRPGVSLSDTLPNGATDQHLFLSVQSWGQNNLPKAVSPWVETLFASNEWDMTMPVIGPHHEGRIYANTFEAVTRWTTVVPDFDPVRDWPNIQPITAKVVTPNGEEVYCDEHARCYVQLPGLRAEDQEFAHGAGASGLPRDSAPIRVAQPRASNGHGILWLPRKDDEVLIVFLGGDPDKPVILQSLYSPVNVPASPHNVNTLPGNRYLAVDRAREVFGANATHIQHDSTPEQTSLQLHADQTNSQVNLGFMVKPRVDGEASPRGEGLEAITNAAAALRAARGVLVSAWARLQGSGNQLAYDEALVLMQTGLALFKSMGEYAAQHQGLALKPQERDDLTKLTEHWEDGTNTRPDVPQLNTGLIAITAPEGIANTTAQSHVTTAGKNVESVAMHDHQQVAGQQMLMQAGKGIGLFAHDGGIQQIAHQGEFVQQSQNGPMRFESGQTVDVIAKSDIQVFGKSITYTAQCGSYFRIGDGQISMGTPGGVLVHSASFAQDGPQARSATVPSFSAKPQNLPQPYSHRFDVAALIGKDNSNEVWMRWMYEAYDESGKLIAGGAVDKDGRTGNIYTAQPEKIKVAFKAHDSWSVFVDVNH